MATLSGLVVVDGASELLEWPIVLSEELPLEDRLSVPVDGELGSTTEGSFMVVSLELGCELAVCESLVDGCGSLIFRMPWYDIGLL